MKNLFINASEVKFSALERLANAKILKKDLGVPVCNMFGVHYHTNNPFMVLKSSHPN